MHGVSINPTAFLIVQSNIVKLLPVDHENTLDKILDYVPDLIEKVNCMMNKCIQNKKDLGDKIINTMKNKCNEQKNCEEEKTKDCKEESNEKSNNTNNIKVEDIDEIDELDELNEIDDNEQ